MVSSRCPQSFIHSKIIQRNILYSTTTTKLLFGGKFKLCGCTTNAEVFLFFSSSHLEILKIHVKFRV